MNVEKIESQTAVLHLPVTVEDDDAPELKRILQTLFEEGMQFIHVDFTMTKYMRTPGPGLLTLYQKKLTDRGGELKLVNVKNKNVKHVFDMLDLREIMTIEEID